jgi:hypothetical protein
MLIILLRVARKCLSERQSYIPNEHRDPPLVVAHHLLWTLEMGAAILFWAGPSGINLNLQVISPNDGKEYRQSPV